MNGLNPLLPRQADNASYRGLRLALWIFGVLLFLRSVMSAGTIFNARNTLIRADGIPVGTYPADSAQNLIALFALLGLANLSLTIVGIVVLLRYRTLVPAMFVLLLLQAGARQLIQLATPIVRVGAPPASLVMNVLLTLTVVGLACSVWKRRGARA